MNFAAGFFGVPDFLTDYHQLITIEADGFNNTLATYDTCTNANNDIGNFGSVQANKWAAIYLQDAVKRLAPQIKGINLTLSDVFGMQEMCAYEVRLLFPHSTIQLRDVFIFFRPSLSAFPTSVIFSLKKNGTALNTGTVRKA